MQVQYAQALGSMLHHALPCPQISYHCTCAVMCSCAFVLQWNLAVHQLSFQLSPSFKVITLSFQLGLLVSAPDYSCLLPF
jgi:hypothetical protein